LVYVKGLIDILSEDALTATNLSKFSSTKILTASLRLSIALSRCEIPFRRSLYDASGWWADKKVLASKDLDERDVAAPDHQYQLSSQRMY
jgi:hypothetical protein